MSPAPLIRTAAETDLPAVRALLHETWHQVYDPIIGSERVDDITSRWHAVELLARQLHQPQSSFLVAYESEILVAHGFAYLRAPTTLTVSRLYVLPSHQRQGIGARVLAALCARHAEAMLLRLFVAAENARGVAFYRREGFTVVEEGIEEGALVLYMEKRLTPDLAKP
jgi:ribosomal protein S18 acetylase RimI-like enzyme